MSAGIDPTAAQTDTNNAMPNFARLASRDAASVEVPGKSASEVDAQVYMWLVANGENLADASTDAANAVAAYSAQQVYGGGAPATYGTSSSSATG